MAWNASTFSNEWLVGMLANGHTIKKISEKAGTCARTIKRRMEANGLEMYTPLENDEKEATVMEWSARHGYSGWNMLHGALLAKGYRLHKCEVKALLRAADPEASMRRCVPRHPSPHLQQNDFPCIYSYTSLHSRWRQCIERKMYEVAGPMSLWHVDGNHKLILWKFVIHGGIDG
jgi:hypothetical protein